MSLTKEGASEQLFSELFAECFVVGLTNVLGPSGAQATIKHLGVSTSPDVDKIDEGLKKMFAVPGAKVIERQIIKVLFEKMNERFLEESRLTFSEQVEEVRRRLEPVGRTGA